MLSHSTGIVRRGHSGYRIAFIFQRGDLIEHKIQPAEQTFDPGRGVGRDRFIKTASEVGQAPSAIFQQWVVAIDAERCEDGADSVG